MMWMCPYCGCLFHPEVCIGRLMPSHFTDAKLCPGSGQNPRNPESDRRPLWKDQWMPLLNLRNGAIFETREGVMAMKTEYHTFNGGDMANGQCDCYLLESGECAHFKDRDNEMVREINLSVFGEKIEKWKELCTKYKELYESYKEALGLWEQNP